MAAHAGFEACEATGRYSTAATAPRGPLFWKINSTITVSPGASARASSVSSTYGPRGDRCTTLLPGTHSVGGSAGTSPFQPGPGKVMKAAGWKAVKRPGEGGIR